MLVANLLDRHFLGMGRFLLGEKFGSELGVELRLLVADLHFPFLRLRFDADSRWKESGRSRYIFGKASSQRDFTVIIEPLPLGRHRLLRFKEENVPLFPVG